MIIVHALDNYTAGYSAFFAINMIIVHVLDNYTAEYSAFFAIQYDDYP